MQFVKQCGQTIDDIFCELGPYYIQKAYRMPEADFWTILDLIQPHIPRAQVRNKKEKETM